MAISPGRRRLRVAAATLMVAALIPPGLSSTSIAAPAAADITTVQPLTGPAGEAARTPYMGWSSYSMQVYSNNGGTWINAAQLKAQSDAMHQKLQPYGYKYINIDAGWNDGVDAYGRPKPSTTLFPNGFSDVIDYIHANGQKVGIYSIPGISPALEQANLPVFGHPECRTGDLALQPLQQADYWGFGHRIDMSKPCSQAYLDSIADLYAEWGIDFLKFDSVTPGSGHSDLSLDARAEVAGWSQALTPHGIWFELSWALDLNYADYWKQYANGWRVDWDVECYCPGQALTAWPNVSRLFPKLAEWWRHGGPGGWNDLDSLNVGNGAMDGLTQDERRTAATLWAVSAAPFYVGNDLTQLDQFGLSLLTNTEVLAVNQAGRPAQPVSTATDQQVWYSLNADNSYTVALFNLGGSASTVTANWSDLGLTGGAQVRDLWAKQDLGSFASGFTATAVPAHGVRLLKVTPQAGSTINVNDDDQRVAYAGTWQRNGGREVTTITDSLALTVADTTAGGTAPAGGVRTTEVNNDNPAINYTGTWSRSWSRGLGDYQDDVQYAETNGDAFSYTFTGTGIDYVTEKHASQGDVDIYVDGVFKQTVSTYQASGRGAQQVVYGISGLTNGIHTIRGVKKTGQFMLLDKFNVRTPGGVRIISLNDNDAQITYTGSWGNSTGRGFGDYRDDVQYAEANGDAFSSTFTGTGVDYITETHASQGDVDIYIDGIFKQTVNAGQASGRGAQQVVYSISGLTNGTHTIRGVKRSGQFMLVDRLDVRQPSLLTPDTAVFDKKTSAQADVVVQLGRPASDLTSIQRGSTTLVNGTDYTTSGAAVTLKKSYLVAQPTGYTNLNFTFRSDYHNDIHATTANGAALEFAFKGTTVTWLTATAPDQGEADVYVDNVLIQRVNLQTATRGTLQSIFTRSGLTSTDHTLRIVKVSGSLLRNDVIRYTTA
ncbi:X2-like carbohydrate binding domain-containing protein [Kribbella koreensis]